MRPEAFAWVALFSCACRGPVAARVGAVFESRTRTHVSQPLVHDTEQRTRETVVARTAGELVLEVESSAAGVTGGRFERRVPLEGGSPPEACPSARIVEERCTVPAGTFRCKRVEREGAGSGFTTWTAAGIPVPIRTVLTSESLTSTTELVRIAVADAR
jgi:hypothetical protein